MKDNLYSKMQREYYISRAEGWTIDTDDIVGAYSIQNRFKDQYYNNLFGTKDTSKLVALEFGCGPGRNIENYHHLFKRIDGVDFPKVAKIAQNRLDNLNIDYTGKIYGTDGYSLDTPELIPSDTYDIVYSVISFHHICVYDIRLNYLKEFYRVLKKGGSISIQMAMLHSIHHIGELATRSTYYENVWDATATNGYFDTSVQDPEQIRSDLEDIIGFKDFTYDIVLATEETKDIQYSDWIYFQATK